ncbi:zonadhesin-like isoform X1 [Ostrinia furnacalis]|uniref:zonadhesin-like isoform X1 n=1 Tax=Ostrinia furnacalis TaxID=93504 RepID=UPI001039B79F|nr:zonadhesin-like isoform X1 [Ostrinia furnacalis]
MFEVTMLKLVLLAAITADVFLVVSTTVCKPNEEYNDCINRGCNAQNCSQLGLPLPCVDVDPKDCIPGYICKSGYTRADNGTCIPTDQCPSCGGDPNAVSGCGTFCTKCSNYKKGPIACPAICRLNGCDCRKGYIYDQNIKKCVLPKQCTPTCKDNEVYSDCINGGCSPRNCSQLGKPQPCVKLSPDACIKGCVCKSGYLKADNGTCIPSKQCPSCGGDPNAESGCGTFCKRCSNYKNETLKCPIGCILNGCQCKEGFIYDQNIKKCVRPKQCTPTCKANEEYSDCVNGGCTRRNCSQLGKPVRCVKLKPGACIKGCVCKSGYLKAKNGTCIPVKQCPCKPNEEYSDCINRGCYARNCSQLGYPLACADVVVKDEDCIEGFICKPGYTRADNGTCIPTDQCPSCGGDPNAESGCGSFCKRCSNYKNESLICPIGCILNGCQCREGYIYDQNTKKCVLPKQCTPTCKINEVYSECTNTGCTAQNCSQLGTPVPCVRLDPKYCKKGCVCDAGYLRADNGTCIPEKECPACGGDPNAESGCGTFCETCTNYKSGPVACPDICLLNGCQCRKGYIYDPNIKKCVLPEQCTPTCKANEVYSDCNNSGCDPRNCSQLGNPVPCVDISPDSCIKGCVCASGFLRADNGTCIPEKQCPACGGDPNAESGCGTFCETCTNYKSGPVACPDICVLNGCQCKEGYIYDPNIKKCVLPEQCTPTCKANEVYSDCINSGCDPRNCSQLGNPVACVDISPDACIKGCVCASGYLRADNGTCIPEKQCPSCGGDPNAESGCGVFCDRCSGPIPCPRICYPNSCQCKSGYIYDQNIKKCVLPNQCTPTCKDNEEYSDCINGGCGPRNCSQLGNPVACVDISPDACIKGCVCASGFLRADNGTCIPEKQCPSCGDDPNAESGCGVFCDRCSGPIKCPRICYPNGCQCKSGYIYDQNIKKCVLPNQCTPTCKDNEEYSDCINGGCDARNCSQLGNPIPCVKLNPDDCIKGCVCSSGYLRADNGTCIPEKQCPSCGDDPNAESGCGVFCDRCSGPIKCPRICHPNSCQCKSGYIYDQNIKKCVLPNQCTPTCKDNEEYSDCINGGCDARNCSQLGNPIPCVKLNPDDCIKGCVCSSGYLRADNGTCIPVKECPSCGGDPNAESGCGVFCNRCSGPIPCPKICEVNGCQCKPNYIYDDNTKKCVLPEQCTPTCKDHEVYSNCVNGGCLRRNCSQVGKPILCVLVTKGGCIKGCICESGYLRDDKGNCIPEDQCQRCQEGEVYSKCANGVCPPQSCSLYGKPLPLCSPINPASCKPGCICANGYLRNKDGVCIPKEKCPERCQKGEVYSECANGICPPQTCSWYGKPVPPCAPMNPDSCKPGCICAKGNLRNTDGVCIPEEKCPEASCKNKVNEVYSDCVNGGCDARNCSQLGNPVPCVKISPEDCKKGCICDVGFLRAANGTCIPQKQCPSCGGDPNAEAGCGVFCDLCSGPIPCPKICKVNGCQCKPGYKYDQNIQKCVLPKQCTPTCKCHEVYSDCINGGCARRNCSQLDKPVACVSIIEGGCIKGCVCETGYLRADNGTCIPESQCPRCKSGEEYSTCANGICRLQYCSQYGAPIPFCPAINTSKCKPGCICKKKFLKNKDGVCIPQEECPEAQCPPGEIYSQCSNAPCMKQYCIQYGINFLSCLALEPKKKCKPGCICKDGYLRTQEGMCIPEDTCPEAQPPCLDKK